MIKHDNKMTFVTNGYDENGNDLKIKKTYNFKKSQYKSDTIEKLEAIEEKYDDYCEYIKGMDCTVDYGETITLNGKSYRSISEIIEEYVEL
jgi:hypothetical protein